MQQPPLYQPPIPEAKLRSGIVFGPGRATRMPEKGTREYLELVERMRGTAGQNQ
jgi:hypothetical protein